MFSDLISSFAPLLNRTSKTSWIWLVALMLDGLPLVLELSVCVACGSSTLTFYVVCARVTVAERYVVPHIFIYIWFIYDSAVSWQVALSICVDLDIKGLELVKSEHIDCPSQQEYTVWRAHYHICTLFKIMSQIDIFDWLVVSFAKNRRLCWFWSCP